MDNEGQKSPPRKNGVRRDSGRIGEKEKRSGPGHFTHAEELNLLKKKCQSLQMALDKSHDERQNLELQLVAEKTHKEQAVKNVEDIAEKKQMEFNGQLHSVKLDQERWKLQAESTTKEVQMLQEQLKLAQIQKSDALKKLSKLTEEHMEMDTHRRSIFLQRKQLKDVVEELTKRLQGLQVAKDELFRIQAANKEQLGVFNVYINDLRRQNTESNETIGKLEEEIVLLKSIKAHKDKLVTDSTRSDSGGLQSKASTENKTPSKNLNLFSGKYATKKDLDQIYGNITIMQSDNNTPKFVQASTLCDKSNNTVVVGKNLKSAEKNTDDDFTPFEMSDNLY